LSRALRWRRRRGGGELNLDEVHLLAEEERF